MAHLATDAKHMKIYLLNPITGEPGTTKLYVWLFVPATQSTGHFVSNCVKPVQNSTK